MIEFLQDYATRAHPPEVFTDGQRVSRSTESELYFVKLGVAAYVHDGELVDADYRPTARKVIVVEPVNATAVVTGRGGEMPLGVATPGLGSTGPGNAALFGGDQQSRALQADFTRQAEELDAVRGQLAQAGEAHAGQLKEALAERDDALKQRDAARGEIDQVRADADTSLKAAQAERDEARAQLAAVTAERDAVLAAATQPDGATDAAAAGADAVAAKKGK